MMASLATEGSDSDEFQSQFKNVNIYQSDCLGSGAYGVVCKAVCDQLPCAAKLLHQSFVVMGQSWVTDKFLQECAFLSSIKHPNIVQFLGIHRDPSSKQPVLLMELMDESLTHFLTKFDSLESVPLHLQVDICHDITLAIHYLHSNGIIHRDLSSNNVLLIAGKRAKITDFGMSKLTSTASIPLSSYTQVPGCPVYMPPEAWLNPPIYTETLDIFSFGVLVLQIITRKSPSPGPSEVLIADKRSPTGFLKLPVPETERRAPDIDLVPSEHPLREEMLNCLLDIADERPSAKRLCLFLTDIKKSTSYQESCEIQTQIKKVPTEDGEKLEKSLDDSKIAQLETSYKKQLEEKNKEIEELEKKVANLQSDVVDLADQLSDRESQIEQLKSELKRSTKPTKSHHYPRPGVNTVTLSGFSPEVLSIIVNDRNMSVYQLRYDLESGSVTFFAQEKREELLQNIRVFLQIYKHVFNSGQMRLDFVPISSSFPMQLLGKSLKLCELDHRKSSFKHLEDAKMVKVISQTPELLLHSSQQLSNYLNLTITLPSEKKLTVKYGSIIDEEVSIIVSAASPDLTQRWGVAAAINVASGFEVQKHVKEYTEKYGNYLASGEVMSTKAGGSLKCDWIIHAVGTSGVFQGESHNPKMAKIAAEIDETLKKLVSRILHKAEALQATSIAIPAIGTGSMGLDCSIAASAIIEGIIQFKFKPQSSITSIRLVLLKEDIFEIFAETLIDRSSLVFSKVLKSSAAKDGKSPQTRNALTKGNHPDVSDIAPSSCKQQ